jgi:hypothetical protein
MTRRVMTAVCIPGDQQWPEDINTVMRDVRAELTRLEEDEVVGRWRAAGSAGSREHGKRVRDVMRIRYTPHPTRILDGIRRGTADTARARKDERVIAPGKSRTHQQRAQRGVGKAPRMDKDAKGVNKRDKRGVAGAEECQRLCTQDGGALAGHGRDQHWCRQ